jgi:xanthine dehydrogenase accessory factor
MINVELSTQFERLLAEREPFVLATVVRARRPTSVRPGNAALVRADGTIDGFVGGICAESSVRLYSLRVLETGEPLLLRLVPGDGDGADPDETIEGAVVERNPCLSGGSLEIFLEPHLPAPRVLVLGGSPIARALEQVGQAAGYECRRTESGDGVDVDGAAAVIVASHGSDEEGVLAAALKAGVPYVALVASRKRGASVRDALELPVELRSQLHTPAGLDIGARTPAEIAVSVLAEVIAEHHAHPSLDAPEARLEVPAAAPAAVDPICGMQVAVSPATPQLLCAGEPHYFCGPGCRDAYARQHADEITAG